MWFFLFTRHIMCRNLNCVCQLTCILFVCKFLRVKYQKLCQNIHRVQPMCMFDKFHLTFNFKSKLSRDVFINTNECQLTPSFFFFLICHFNVTCLVVCVISICEVSIDAWFFSLQVTLHVKIWIVCVSWRAFCLCASFCVSNIKNLQKLYKKYTLSPTCYMSIDIFCLFVFSLLNWRNDLQISLNRSGFFFRKSWIWTNFFSQTQPFHR